MSTEPTRVEADWGEALAEVRLPDEADLSALRELAKGMRSASPDARARAAIEQGLLRDLTPIFHPETRRDIFGKAVMERRVPDLALLVAAFEAVADALGFPARPPEGDESEPLGLSLRSSRIDQCLLSADTVRWPIEINHCHFAHAAYFHGPTFQSSADFTGSTFHGPVEFSIVRFQAAALFTKTVFRSEVELLSVEFADPASFQAARFHSRLRFPFAVRFGGAADFSQATFEGRVDFEGATFAGPASMKGADFHEPVNLREAIFEPGSRLDLHELRYRGSSVLGGNLHLRLDQIRFGGWPGYRGRLMGERAGDAGFPSSGGEQYGMLEANYSAEHSPDAAQAQDWCHYRYLDLNRQTKYSGVRLFGVNLSFFRWLDWLFLKWCFGYGVYTKRILFSGLATILLFGLIYYTGFFGRPENYWTIENSEGVRLAAEGVWYVRLGDALYFSTVTFATVGYGDWHPVGWAKLAGALEGLLGVFTMSLFTVSFARKVIR